MKNAMPQPLHPGFIADNDRHGAVMDSEVFPVVWRAAWHFQSNWTHLAAQKRLPK
jgi:hypothetical protein